MASIASLQAAPSSERDCPAGAAAVLCDSARGVGAAGNGAMIALADGTVALSDFLAAGIAAVGATAAGTSGAATADARPDGAGGCCIANGCNRSGMAKISSDSPTRNSNETSQILTDQTDLAGTGKGAEGMARLDEIA